MKQAITLIVLLLSLSACRPGNDLIQTDLNALYDPATRLTRPEGQAIHLNDTATMVLLQLKLADFSYQKSKPDAVPMARIMIRYTLSDSYETKDILHKDSVYITDSVHLNAADTRIQNLVFPLKEKGEFLFSAVVSDENNDKESRFLLVINKGDINFRENFFISGEEGQVIPGDRLPARQPFRLRSIANEGNGLYVRYYKRQFPIALPPFSVDNAAPFDYKADSTFRLDYSGGTTDLLVFEKKGFYHFQTDTTNKQGFTIFVTDPDFPRLSLPQHILEPLRYISTAREFEQLSAYENPKLAVDSFWLAHAGLESRAKTLLSKYYNRVQEANTLFSSYLDGWKTDRGMVYIIFGPPNHVFRATNTENWTYGELTRMQSLRFSFVRVNNPFTNNDFSLMRNPQYKEFWFNSVEVWRR